MTADPRVLDMAASTSPDFVCIDTQHGVDISRLDVATFTSLDGYGVPGLVRVESNDPTPIGRALDLGAVGVVVPMVEDADDARSAVAACRYAPDGVRSFGVQTRRIDPLAPDSVPWCWIQIETASALQNLDEVAAVDGVDALYIGPADLGLAICGTAAPDIEAVVDGEHPCAGQLRSAFDAVIEACAANDVMAGIHCGTGLAASRAAERGFQIAAVGADLSLLGMALRSELATARTGL